MRKYSSGRLAPLIWVIYALQSHVLLVLEESIELRSEAMKAQF